MTRGEERTYRLLNRQKDLAFFRVVVRETDLDIGVPEKKLNTVLVEKVRGKVLAVRKQLEDYLATDHRFIQAMSPYSPPPSAPEIALQMAREAAKAGVGPMAAVAGAFSEMVGRFLSLYTDEVIVENGGDIYLRSSRPRTIGIFAARSPFSNRIGLQIKPYQTPLGICTSSGVIGHSVSMGKADAVVVLAPSVPLADAVATAAGNLVKNSEEVQNAVEFALTVPGVRGALAIKGDKLSAAGDIEIKPI